MKQSIMPPDWGKCTAKKRTKCVVCGEWFGATNYKVNVCDKCKEAE
jgi:hypothetical protein